MQKLASITLVLLLVRTVLISNNENYFNTIQTVNITIDNIAKQDTINLDSLSLNKDNIYFVLNYYDIKFPDIVYKQILLETGYLKSRNCIKKNNLLGIKDKRNYKKYIHWSKCIKHYKNRIQNRYNYKSNHKENNYYSFLRKIRYAKDKKYIAKLKKIKL